MSLTLTAQPGFTAIPSTTFAAGNPLTDSAMQSLLADALFSAVRNEQFYGYYCNGETVVLPVSPADGYEYSRAELLYSHSRYWSGSATGACGGALTPPACGATTGQGTVLQWQDDVNQASGLVRCYTAYFKTGQQDTNDGIVLVITHAQRSR
jgi:hypothetical protein